jgi:hypothetical protein
MGKSTNLPIKSLKLRELDKAGTHTDLTVTPLNLFTIKVKASKQTKKLTSLN